MNIIKNNPFRVLGLPANSKERIIQKQISLLKKFATIGKEKSFELDFLFFGKLDRTHENIQLASSKIEQMPQRIHNALFWFINKSTIDETAIDYLKDGDIDKAIEIWQKTLKEEITDRNYASYANLSTLFIGVASANTLINKQLLKQGIELKSKLLSSEKLQLFVSDITRTELVPEFEKLNSNFVNEILQLTKPHLENKQISKKELISYFNSFPASIKKNVLSRFTDTHIYNIENEIEKTINKRKTSPREAAEYGEQLYKNTKVDITELKNLFGQNSIQFQMITDKLANEILQCSIKYFNDRQDNGSNSDFELYLNNAMKLVKLAESVAISSQIKERVEEAMNTLLGMKDRVINQAITLLSSIKLNYEKACREIDKRVEEIEYITMPGTMGGQPMKVLRHDISIDWSKVDKMKKQSLDWDKVVEVVIDGISLSNIVTIQNCSNQKKVTEYKELVDFLFSKLESVQMNQIKYLSYWEPSIITSNTKLLMNRVMEASTNTTRSYSSSNSSEDSYSSSTNSEYSIAIIGKIIFWIGMILGFLIWMGGAILAGVILINIGFWIGGLIWLLGEKLKI